MAGIADLARIHTPLRAPDVDHLIGLVGSWGLLADLCFSDLMLFASMGHPADGEGAERFLVLSQVRPTTGQTLYKTDWIGRVVTDHERPLVARCMSLGEIISGEVPNQELRELVRVLCIPVRRDGRTVAVLTREAASSVGRHTGELERTYVEVFHRFARMIATGEFPFRTLDEWEGDAPRVGDGALLLDGTGRIEFASPNAISALHRLGVHGQLEGNLLGELNLPESAVRSAFGRGVPAYDEMERPGEVTVSMWCLPLLEHGTTTGALALLHDISEVRRRDRLLLSKDATIREIHHRVKNNLQTISSLLRLQARRPEAPEAKAALEESVRRIRSIALVHETLSLEAGDDVPFLEIVRPLVRMVEEGLVSPERPVSVTVVGDAGKLPATMATSLSVVLTELLQNAMDHAFPLGSVHEPSHVELRLGNDGRSVTVLLRDDGVGLPEGFDLEASTGLGLSIVRTLVTTELGGTISMRRGRGDATRPGTVVELVVPLSEDPLDPLAR